MTLDEAREHVGERVIYTDERRKLREVGTITSVNAVFVFVRYGVDLYPKATYADVLTLEAPA